MQPLADRMRPQSFDEMVGQAHLFGPKGAVRRMIDQNYMTNMIFYGPPGTGKTTAAKIIAGLSGMELFMLNATSATLADVKEVIAGTNSMFGQNGILLYLDEIQYFNKKQQQSLLEYIEDGRITLITSTTENPYLYVYNAIISRSAVFEFYPVQASDILPALTRGMALLNEQSGKDKTLAPDAAQFIADAAAGDVRRSFMLLESAYYACGDEIIKDDIEAFCPKVIGNFDKSGTVHYDMLSALQKSIRGSDPDAAIFYLCKILEGGDLPGACRRLQVIASEDIGLAYPQAAAIVRACIESAKDLGMPEASIPLSHAAILLATSPKSNKAHIAYEKAKAAINAGKGQTVPPCLRPSNRYAGYLYPHDYPGGWVDQQYLPDDLKDEVFYEFGQNKTEQQAKAYWQQKKGKA